MRSADSTWAIAKNDMQMSFRSSEGYTFASEKAVWCGSDKSLLCWRLDRLDRVHLYDSFDFRGWNQQSAALSCTVKPPGANFSPLSPGVNSFVGNVHSVSKLPSCQPLLFH